MKIFLWSETKPELSTWVYNALSFDIPARSGSTLKAQPNETGNSERVVGNMEVIHLAVIVAYGSFCNPPRPDGPVEPERILRR